MAIPFGVPLVLGGLQAATSLFGGGGNDDVQLQAQHQAQQLAAATQAANAATENEAMARQNTLQSEQRKGLLEQQALQQLVQGFRETLLGGGQ